MSKFKTAIPVDVEGVKRLLPAGSFIHAVEWDQETSGVQLTWENDALRTSYSFPWPMSVEELRAKLPPPAAATVSPPEPETAKAPEPAPGGVEEAAMPPVSRHRRGKV